MTIDEASEVYTLKRVIQHESDCVDAAKQRIEQLEEKLELERTARSQFEKMLHSQAETITKQQNLIDILIDALEEFTSSLHTLPGGEECKCSQCKAVRKKASALATVKGEK